VAFSSLTISTEYLIIGLSVLVVLGICLYDNVKRDEVKKNFFVLASDPLSRCFQLSYNAVAFGTVTHSMLLFIVAFLFQFHNFSYDVDEVLEVVVEKIPEFQNVLFMHRGPQKVTQTYIDRSRTTIINNPITIINHLPPEVKNPAAPVNPVDPVNSVSSTSERVYTAIVAGISQVMSFGVALGNHLWDQTLKLTDQNQKLEKQVQQKDEKIRVLEQKKLAEIPKSAVATTADLGLKQEISKTDQIAIDVSKQGLFPADKKNEK